MFCPGCGNEENGPNQYCRRCGSDLRVIKAVLEDPNVITAQGRDEVGRALAAKIREVNSVKDLTRVTTWVLPKVEKFLESPEERRLRRIRAGTITASVGSGGAIACSILGVLFKEEPFFLAAGVGVFVFFIGLGILINGFLSSIPKPSRPIWAPPSGVPHLTGPTDDPALTEPAPLFASVTENTTTHLEEKRR